MESDDDFIAPPRFTQTQYRQSSANLSQAVSSSSMSQSLNGSQARASRPSQPRSQVSSQAELSQIQDGLRFLMDRVQQLSGDRGIKRPGEAKPFDKQPDVKQECQICHKLYANKTTLFRHYRGIHQEMNPEKYHGCSVNGNVVSLDTSINDAQCPICHYAAPNQNALDNHCRITHANEINASSNKTTVAKDNKVTDKENVNVTIKNNMHKCEECACYFEERSKFDEHMKTQHGFEVVCKICNKHFFFKDIDGHVKDTHPDVYKRKRKENDEKVIIEKVLKNRKGNKVRVYICTKCDIKMYDNKEAEKHDKGHKRRLKVAPRNNTSKDDESITVVDSNDYVILTCVACNISTGSYDAAVEHSQNHITNHAKAITFATQLCEICDLKFEPLCFKKHIDLHYKNKEVHKETFKYFKYRYELLLSENWIKCFDKTEPVIKKMVSESIYEHTRAVKMRVLQEGAYRLYKCCKCDDFVDPAAVLNHTVNYDTCVKVKCSYSCNICKRTFNNRLYRNNHVNNHKREAEYKIVIFNHVNDKELNEELNAFKFKNPDEHVGISNSNDVTKVLYKCLCGLCFVRKETADKHTIICPGKNDKNSCPKCGNFFKQDELVAHCLEHHLNETRIHIENIVPEVIVIDSDEEIIEIDSSDEDDIQKEQPDNIQITVLKTEDSLIRGCSEGGTDTQKLDTPGAVRTKVGVVNEGLMISEEPLLTRGKAEKENNNEDKDESRSDGEFGELGNEMTDDDSRDTISNENIGTNQTPDINNRAELKLVPTDLLLNPLHFGIGFLNVVDMGALNAEIISDIENVRQHIETTTDVPFNEITIKQEKSWLNDPTDFSNICRRPSLRQITMHPSSSQANLEVESLLTDDEEIDNNQNSEKSGNKDLDKDSSGIDIPSNTPIVITQSINDITPEDISNKILHIINGIVQRKSLNISKEIRNIIDDDKTTTELNKYTFQEAIINNNAQILNTEIENNEGNFSDDDLFLPSGVPKELDDNEKEIHNVIKLISAEQVVNQVTFSGEKRADDTTNAETGTTENALARETEHDKNEAEHINNVSRQIENGTELIENVRSENKNNDSRNVDTNETEFDKAMQADQAVSGVQPDPDEYILNNGESQINIQTDNDNLNDITSVIVNETPVNQTILKDVTVNIKKEFQYMNINIKREIIAENETDTNNSSVLDRVRVKEESNDISDTEWNENKEDREGGHLVIKKVEKDNYNNCSIV